MVLHPNDDDPAVAAPEPHLPLLNDDDDDNDITEPWPVPSPPPKEVVDIIELKRYRCQNCCLPWPFNNNSYSSDDDDIRPEPYRSDDDDICQEIYVGSSIPPFSNNSYSSDDDDIRGEPESSCTNNSYNSYNISNPPHDQLVSSSALQQQKRGSSSTSRNRKKPSSNNNLDLKWNKGHVMVKVRTTPTDIIKLENNTRIIPEEEAVCRFCFQPLFPVNNDHYNNNNNTNVLKMKCQCHFALSHEHCATEWSGTKGNIKCDACDQDINYIPVTLSTPPSTSEEKPNKGSFINTLKKWNCFTTG